MLFYPKNKFYQRKLNPSRFLIDIKEMDLWQVAIEYGKYPLLLFVQKKRYVMKTINLFNCLSL